MENHNASTHLVICSNRWFSAISDYCLQLMMFLQMNQRQAIFISQVNTPLANKCKEKNFTTEIAPLWPSSFFSFFASWATLTKTIKKHQPRVVWVFEGREHTLCALHKVIFPLTWKNIVLVRMRGQAAPAKNNFFNLLTYKILTNKIVFVAEVVKARTKIKLRPNQSLIQPYCTDLNTTNKPDNNYFDFLNSAPKIDFNLPTFLVLGRYDPVKGHEWLIKSFAQMEQKPNDPPSQLIFIGKSENIKAVNLAELAKNNLRGEIIAAPNRYYIQNNNAQKRIFIFDEYVVEAINILKNTGYGLIPSLGSEVICRVAVEFMQAGIPIICSDAGALPEITMPSDAIIVPVNNFKLLTKALSVAYNTMAFNQALHAKQKEKAKQAGLQLYSLKNLAHLVTWVENK